jgi:N-acetylmuramoyl-L-alanine amidase
MLPWKLRVFWYRADKEVLGFAAFCAIVVALLGFAASLVFDHRDTQAARLRDFHAQSIHCLALNVYYEARSESLAGQYAVAEVTMNRKASPHYPKTVCEVVYQREAFSWTSQRRLEKPYGEAWERALKVAHDVYYQRRPPALPGATHYHATYVQPDWSKERRKLGRIGQHVFYR